MAGPFKVSFLRGAEVAAGVTAFMYFKDSALLGPLAALLAAGFVHLADAWIMPRTLG
ncbi:MAG: hypothetical protein HYZ53_17130 [Planctomycetes bacterium]|nr:hypothetical protein [Planctomycetota bacterium]